MLLSNLSENASKTRSQTMRKSLIAMLIAGAAAGTAAAQSAPVHNVYAPVVDVEPVYRTERVPVEREVCWQERVAPRRKHGSATGTIAGAIIGGVIGNQFGDGNGRRALTAAGAALGASIGNDASRRGHRHARPTRVERCEIQVDYESRSYRAGFDVAYEFNGQVHSTWMQRHPGDSVRLEVVARPVD
jgi:uncharacterized protein YcfJ